MQTVHLKPETESDLMTPRGEEAQYQSTMAILNAAVDGSRPNCSDPESHRVWLSEHPEERTKAAVMCGGCCVISQCDTAATANGERLGTWGKDRTVTPGPEGCGVMSDWPL